MQIVVDKNNMKHLQATIVSIPKAKLPASRGYPPLADNLGFLHLREWTPIAVRTHYDGLLRVYCRRDDPKGDRRLI